MKIISVSFGKKISVKYEDGDAERTVKSAEPPRLDFKEALRNLSMLWSEKLCEKDFSTDLATYIKKSAPGVEEPFPLLDINRVDVSYIKDDPRNLIDSYCLTGVLYASDFLRGTLSALVTPFASAELYGALSRFLKEAEAYAEGARAQETLPGWRWKKWRRKND